MIQNTEKMHQRKFYISSSHPIFEYVAGPVNLNNFGDRLKNSTQLRTLFTEKHTYLVSCIPFQKELASLQVSTPGSRSGALASDF